MAINSGEILVFGDAVTDVGLSALYPLGASREEGGKFYRYVKFDNGAGNIASIVGGVAFHFDGAWTVTMDLSDSDAGLACGVFLAVIADQGFGWVQSGGRATVATSGVDDIVLGDALVSDLTADGVVRRLVIAGANPTAAETRQAIERVIGVARAADNDGANTVDAMLYME